MTGQCNDELCQSMQTWDARESAAIFAIRIGIQTRLHRTASHVRTLVSSKRSAKNIDKVFLSCCDATNA